MKTWAERLIALGFVVLVVLVGLAPGIGAATKIRTPEDLASLVRAKLDGECADYTPTGKGPGGNGAGSCTIQGFTVGLVLFKSHRALVKGFAANEDYACPIAKRRGISRLDYVVGRDWEIAGGLATRRPPIKTMKRWAKALGVSTLTLCT